MLMMKLKLFTRIFLRQKSMMRIEYCKSLKKSGQLKKTPNVFFKIHAKISSSWPYSVHTNGDAFQLRNITWNNSENEPKKASLTLVSFLVVEYLSNLYSFYGQGPKPVCYL